MFYIMALLAIIVIFAVPVLLTYLIAKRYKEKNSVKGNFIKVFIVGSLAFFISQFVLRIPLMTYVLPKMTWYSIMQLYSLSYSVFLGLTAGIFEEVARFLFMKFMIKGKYDFEHGLVFGLGHGGIEAILITGISVISLLICNNQDVSAVEIFTGTFERIFAVTLHIGLSLIVLKGVRCKKGFIYTVIAVVLHALIDTFAAMSSFMQLSIVLVEGIIVIYSVIVLVIAVRLWKNEREGVGI